jgi:hypothetical protein
MPSSWNSGGLGDQPAELLQIGRLGHVVIEARRRGAPPVLGLRIAGERDQARLA